MMMRALLILAFFATILHAETDADRAWAQIESLRQGPGEPANDAPEEIVRTARAHLFRQEAALEDFLKRFPDDSRRFEAGIELAGVDAALGASLSDRQRMEKSLQRLAAIERSDAAPTKQRADAAFQRITTTMQTVVLADASRSGEANRAGGTILKAVRNFASRYPEDRRAARLLAEAATLLDDQPALKRKTLEQASILARDDATRLRIADDLKRLDLLGRSPQLAFDTLQGGHFSLAAQRGRIVFLIFWAGWSPPSVAWLADFSTFAAKLPSNRVTVATVSLDRVKANAEKTLQTLKIGDWPTAFDGRGWEGEIVRQLGINALPTIFIFDAEGRLRALNARDTYRSVLRQLLEKPGVKAPDF